MSTLSAESDAKLVVLLKRTFQRPKQLLVLEVIITDYDDYFFVLMKDLPIVELILDGKYDFYFLKGVSMSTRSKKSLSLRQSRLAYSARFRLLGNKLNKKESKPAEVSDPEPNE